MKYENYIGETVVTVKPVRIFASDGSWGAEIPEDTIGKVIAEKMIRSGYCWVVDFHFVKVYIDKRDFGQYFQKTNIDFDGIHPIVDGE